MSDATERQDPGTRDSHEREARRQFLRKVGRAGAMVPAVSLLLAANFERASAGPAAGSGGSGSS